MSIYKLQELLVLTDLMGMSVPEAAVHAELPYWKVVQLLDWYYDSPPHKAQKSIVRCLSCLGVFPRTDWTKYCDDCRGKYGTWECKNRMWMNKMKHEVDSD